VFLSWTIQRAGYTFVGRVIVPRASHLPKVDDEGMNIGTRSLAVGYLTIRLEEQAGPVRVDGRLEVTPVARSLTLCRWPTDRERGGDGGPSDGRSRGAVVFARTWPSSVLVSADGQMRRMPIFDMTRLAQIAIVLLALAWILEMPRRRGTRKERS
jgi:hypothetical protein